MGKSSASFFEVGRIRAASSGEWGRGTRVGAGGRLSRAVILTIADGKIIRLEIIGEPNRLQALDLAVLAD